jgi:hypothetical protein
MRKARKIPEKKCKKTPYTGAKGSQQVHTMGIDGQGSSSRSPRVSGLREVIRISPQYPHGG